MSTIKDDNYLTIQGWQINQLGLKGNELIIYAAIYGFTQAEGQWFTGSQQYLADWTNSTTRGVRKALTSLEEKGLLLIAKNGKSNKYRAIRPEIEEQSSANVTEEQSSANVTEEQSSANVTEEQSSAKQRNKVPLIEEQSSYNNIDIDIENNLVKKERKKAVAQNSYNEILDSMVTDPKLKEALIEFIKMRKLSKKPPTDHALELLIKKLYKLSSDPQTQIEIVEQSILNNWKGFFPLKQMDNKIGAKGYSERGTSRDKQYSELEQRIINFGSRSE